MHKPYEPITDTPANELARERYFSMTTNGLDSASVRMPSDLMLDVLKSLHRHYNLETESELMDDFINYLYDADCAAGAAPNADEWKIA